MVLACASDQDQVLLVGGERTLFAFISCILYDQVRVTELGSAKLRHQISEEALVNWPVLSVRDDRGGAIVSG